MIKLKLFVLASCFFLASLWASDDEVRDLCQSLAGEFKNHSTQTCHIYYEWADFFSTKIKQDHHFSKHHRATLNSFFTRAAGFGGFDFSKHADTSSSQIWHIGIQALYATGTCHADFPIHTPNTSFGQHIAQMRETYCYKALNERLPNLHNLVKTKKDFESKTARTPPKSTIITPFFVGKNGELYVLASTDVSGYSAAYGGDAEGKPQEKLLEELNEELAGYFWNKNTSQKPTKVEQKASEQLKKAHEALKLYQRAPAHYHLAHINTHCAITTWIHTGKNGISEACLSGVVFLPIEVLNMEASELDRLNSGAEVPVPSLLSQLGYAKTNLKYWYAERGQYTLIQLEKYLQHTKMASDKQGRPVAIPQDRFGRSVRFYGSHLARKEVGTLFRSIGLTVPQYQKS